MVITGRYWSIVLTLCGASVAAVAAQQALTEAPTGFDTPTLVEDPGSRSVSNGITEPAGDSFALDQQIYELTHDVNTGLGPVFNARACADCHQNPVSGGASQFTELRVGHTDASGNFVNPTIPIDDGASSIGGRSLVNDRAVVPEAQEHVPATENIRALRAALNTLGDGFVEAIDDNTLMTIAAQQVHATHGKIHGEAIAVPVLEAPGQNRIGRFGWKDQHSSLLSFIGDAYLNEMGVTNRLRPVDETTIGKVTADPEDVPDDLGLADIDHFAQFIRGTKAPPRDAELAVGADAPSRACIVREDRLQSLSRPNHKHGANWHRDQWRNFRRAGSARQQDHPSLRRFSAARHRDRRRHRPGRAARYCEQAPHGSTLGAAHAAASNA
jgi:hypothetical protein